MLRLFEPKIPTSTQTRIDGRLVEVAVRVSARARSYRLSLPHHGKPVLTVPRHGRWREAEAFLPPITAAIAALEGVATQGRSTAAPESDDET